MKTMILSAALAAATLVQAGAQSVNFSAGAYTGTGAAPGGTSTDTWNQIVMGGADGLTTANNLDSAGNPTDVTFTDRSIAQYGYTGTPDIALFNNYFYDISGTANNPNVTESFGNVAAGLYNVFLYSSPGSGSDRGATFTLNGLQLTAANNKDATKFILNTNYVEFLNVSPDVNGIISFQYTTTGIPSSDGSAAEGDFNGAQLVAATTIPEPSAWGMLLGGLGLLGFINRSRFSKRA